MSLDRGEKPKETNSCYDSKWAPRDSGFSKNMDVQGVVD